MIIGIFKKTRKDKGSLTVEAAVIMPFFICVILSISFFIKIIYTQNVIQHAINETANELAVYSYLYSATGIQKSHDDAKTYLKENSKTAEGQINDTLDALNSLNNTKDSLETSSDKLPSGDIEELSDKLEEFKELSDKNIDDAKKLKGILENAIKNPKQEVISFASLLGNGAFEDVKSTLAAPVIRIMSKKHFATEILDADKRLKSLGVVNGLSGLDFSESRILSDNKTIDIIVRYKVNTNLPINVLPGLYFIQRANVRAWLDGDGKKPGSSDNDTDSAINVWSLSDYERAKKVQQLEGKDTPDNIGITKYNGGDIIDVTSIDLSAKSYIQTGNVKSRINGSIRELQNFSSSKYREIKTRTLIVVIPENSLESRQDVKKLLTEDCLKYAKGRGIILKYKEAYGTSG